LANTLNHKEILQLFNYTSFDFFDHSDPESVDASNANGINAASAVNNYLRLVMNLMNAYALEDSDEFECIYSSYCQQLNNQAKLGGIASSVAKINSVGMRLALNEISPMGTVQALLKTLLAWNDLPCHDIFDHCSETAKK